MQVLSWNVDVNEPYVYDLWADDAYEPYDSTKSYPNLHVDLHNMGQKRVHALGLDRLPTFCNLDEYYFFRTILEWEAVRPTVVLRDPADYKRVMTFSEFLEVFSARYKIIYGQWLWYDPSRVSMEVMFHNDGQTRTFREWLYRV